ncbi:MAG: hypothetical protein HKN90_05485 [Flavobacteriaceae bacterium]|nr:hypothetical protein [Flavobacteriaceae bacterium]
MKPIADLHCHPSLKPVNNSKIKTIWQYKKNLYTRALFKGFLGISPRRWLINSFARDLARHTQSNLDNCYEGNNRLIALSIYPPERPFLKPARPFKRSTDFQRFILNTIFGEKLSRTIDTKIIRVLTGFSALSIKTYLRSIYDEAYVDYFKDFEKEYRYIEKSHQSVTSNAKLIYKPSFMLVHNYKEFRRIKSQHIIAGIISIEGMHALAKYKNANLFKNRSIDSLGKVDQQALKKSFIANINRIKDTKQFSCTPFFITLSHHFNNLISGHAKSFADAKNHKIPGFSNVFDQRQGLNLGITEFGKKLIIDYLLSKHNGRRILIDTKHMSLKARDEYIRIIKDFKTNGDHIPIICSHTAINGIPTRNEAAKSKDTNKLDKRSYISRWDINLTDQDIREIYDSQGLIGILMHDGRMPGGKFKKLFLEFKRGMYNNRESINRLHGQMFLTNVFHIAKINLEHIRSLNLKNQTEKIDEKEAWSTMCLGSDNDGIVDPFDHYNTAATLDEFKNRLSKHIKLNFKPYMKRFQIVQVTGKSCRFFSQNEINDLMLGYSPEQLMERVFSDNFTLFLKRYYTDEYLV